MIVDIYFENVFKFIRNLFVTLAVRYYNGFDQAVVGLTPNQVTIK